MTKLFNAKFKVSVTGYSTALLIKLYSYSNLLGKNHSSSEFPIEKVAENKMKLIVKILVGCSNEKLCSVFLGQVNIDMVLPIFYDSLANLSKFVKLCRATQSFPWH